MGARSELDAAWAEWMKPTNAQGKRTQGETWRRDNPGEWSVLKAYREGGPRPSLASITGRQMVCETAAWIALAPAEPPPGEWTIAAPVEPVQHITNWQGLGLNLTARQDVHDVVIDGTGDSGILVGPAAAGSTVRRVQMARVADQQAVTWGKHAVYGKSPDLLLEDIAAGCGRYCASGFSLRYHGAVLRRFKIDGAPHAITYYETSNVRGAVLIEHGTGSFTGDTAVWMDAETDYQTAIYQSFVFRDVHLTGPASAKFLKVYAGRMQGTVRIEGCTLNGRPVAAADVAGVPGLTVA